MKMKAFILLLIMVTISGYAQDAASVASSTNSYVNYDDGSEIEYNKWFLSLDKDKFYMLLGFMISRDMNMKIIKATSNADLRDVLSRLNKRLSMNELLDELDAYSRSYEYGSTTFNSTMQFFMKALSLYGKKK